MKTYKLKVGETKQYSIEFAGLENGVTGADSNWLDRTSSPVEQLSSHIVTYLDSPSGVTISSTLTNGNTRITYSATAVTAGTYEIQFQGYTTNSPQQTPIHTIVFRVVNP